ncbi:ATP-dependent nuclease [Maribacter stanieri]|uniref:ATP-dependent nuclease n=1 Tax=Maribacter stanieri TaxID=440514 RepID=UPI0030D8C845|tara:strand:+ start:7751 stop:9655 length:1905 start_codon:yes stop_codon:yes gene_type:complete
MYLEEIIIHNYRSCKSLTLSLSENNPNIYIGLNDSGKSTLLQAFDLLLGEKAKYNLLGEGNYKSDLSNTPEKVESLNKILSEKGLPLFNGDIDATYIIGKLRYEQKEGEGYIDINLSTPLTWSIECNKDGVLWLAKKFSNKGGESYLILDDSEVSLELWNLSQANINKKIKEYEVTPEEIENENGKGRFSNFEKIRAIYTKLDSSAKWAEYKHAKNDKDIFPSFNLFDWNTSLDEIISTANAIMKDEIEVHLKPVKTQANESAKRAEKAINEKFGEISKIIKEVAKDVEGINSKVYFDVREKISDIMVTKTFSDGPIHLENQGEGLKRQIWFSLIKAKADTTTDSLNKFIWAFDEPETHLYPRAQREFFDTLNKISKGNVQTLISTHSTIFIDKSNLDKINSVKQEEGGYSKINSCEDVEAIHSSLNVKNSDFLFHDKFLIVEGDTEQYLIPKLYELYTGSTLIKDNVQLINIQGKDKWVMNKAILDKVMEGFKKSDDQIVYLFDNDMSFVIGKGAIKNNMFFVGEQDIEDSISNEIWLDILNNFYDGTFVFTIEEIKSWKNDVVKKVKCNDYEKFYPIIQKRIKSKCMDDVDYDSLTKLPSKGIDSAELLLKYIDDIDKIPVKIKEAFKRLRE